MKTLVCILNQTRSLELTWDTLRKHIIEPFGADLCLAVGTYGEENNFKEKVKYYFPYQEPEDYVEAFEFAKSKFEKEKKEDWKILLNIPGNWLGGIKNENQCGCGAIFMFYRWWLLNCLKENDLIREYDRFIITRSDFFYVGYPKPEDLDQEKIHIPEGEDYGGINDRHMIVPRKYLEECLNLICPVFECPESLFEELKNDEDLNWHPSLDNERHLKFMMKRNGMLNKIERFPSMMYTVRSAYDKTRWSGGTYSSFHKMFIKYPGEYHLCRTRFFEKFLREFSRKDIHDAISSYFDISKEVLFGLQVPERPTDVGWEHILKLDEDLVNKIVGILISNIENWSKEKSPVYFEPKEMITKNDLENKSNWYVREISDFMVTSTSGSTTGNPFKYLRYNPVFDKIEWENHYDMVLDEFDVGHRPHILYFLPHSYDTDGEKFITCSGVRSPSNFVNHGCTRNPIIHHVNFELYRQRQEEFYAFLLDYIKEHQIDVFYTSPPQVNSLCSYIRKFNNIEKVGYLLSVTGDRFLPEDASFLLDGGYFDHICDHMRCWDGGATFFTCKYRNYHLMDNLAWCEEGPNHELICTDYFNLASPFVRYWNGDYCRIAKEYQRCECGRLYRDFEFLESRPFSLKGTNMKEIQEKIRSLGIRGIKQVRCSIQDLSVVSTRNLTDEEKERIQSVSDKFQFKFFCELF